MVTVGLWHALMKAKAHGQCGTGFAAALHVHYRKVMHQLVTMAAAGMFGLL